MSLEFRTGKRGKITIRSSAAAGFFSQATQSCMSIEQRLEQLENKVLDSNPVTRTIHEKAKELDTKLMGMKYGPLYSKFKKMAQGMGRLLIAKEIGVPALAGLCVYNLARNMKPMFYDAEKARQNCECEDISDYMVRNKGKSARTVAKACLGAVAAACGLGESYTVREVARTGVASIVAWPEMKNVFKSAKDMVCGKKSWHDFTQSCALFGTTVAAYAYGSGVWNSSDMGPVDTATPHVDGGHTDVGTTHTGSATDDVGKADGSASLSDAKKKDGKKVDQPIRKGVGYDVTTSDKTIVLPLQETLKTIDDYMPKLEGETYTLSEKEFKTISLQSAIAQKAEEQKAPVQSQPQKKMNPLQKKFNEVLNKFSGR